MQSASAQGRDLSARTFAHVSKTALDQGYSEVSQPCQLLLLSLIGSKLFHRLHLSNFGGEK
jgi:hypothetical protein